jgi:beta-aspartyl-peptidase (threonine type)
MSGPIVVVHGGAGEWPDGTDAAVAACAAAAEAGLRSLSRGSAVDAVVAAVRLLEDAPCCNAGTGAALTRDGTVELDASVMDGSTMRSGAVACLPPFRHPIDVARSVMDDGRYHLLVGSGAAEFAVAHRHDPVSAEQLITPERLAELAELRSRAGNTVGAVALDKAGRLAAATSTGGVAGHHPGRVGDVPIVGAGTYAAPRAACSCTGDGEAFARACAAFSLVEGCPDYVGMDAAAALRHIRSTFRGTGGVIFLGIDGAVAVAHSMRFMPHAIARSVSDITAAASTPGGALDA